MANGSEGSRSATDNTIHEQFPPTFPEKDGDRGLGALQHLFGPVVLIGMVCLAAIGALLLWKMPGYPTYDPSIGTANAKEIFNFQLKDYRDGLGRLDAALSLQALLITTTILVIIRRSDSLNLFGNSIPLSWLHVLIPMGLIYLWLSSGYIVHELILGRMRGLAIANSSPGFGLGYKDLFRDAGWIDGWFVSFVDPHAPLPESYSGIDRTYSKATQILLVAVLGTFISAAHASALAIVSIGCRRYLTTTEKQRLLSYYLFPLVPLTFLLISHFLFAYGGANRNWFQLYVAVVTLPFTALLLWLSARFDRAYPGALQCLRRVRQLSLLGPIDRLPLRNGSGSKNGRERMVALIGDSLSTTFQVSSYVQMLVHLPRVWKINWFLCLPTSGRGRKSVLAKLSDLGDISGFQYASVSARVDDSRRRSILDRVTGTYHFSHQVDEVLSGQFPDILLLWIGHNSVDWRRNGDTASPSLLNELSNLFVRRYETQLRRLLNRALTSDCRATLVVFGLTNFGSFFHARAVAEAQRKTNSLLFPHLESAYKYFLSMRPEYRDGMTELGAILNERLEAMCERLSQQLLQTNVRLLYSNALSGVKMDDTALLSSADAWHPSLYGHGKLADAAYPVVFEEAQFLGWDKVSS
jgi:hypothetical protein